MGEAKSLLFTSDLRMKVVRGTDELSQHSRIRRAGERPEFVLDELAKSEGPILFLKLGWKGRSVELKYRISRQSWLMGERDEIGRRQLFCWILLGRREYSLSNYSSTTSVLE